jgi:hypothetical protein
MTDVIELDKKGTLGALFQFAIVSDMYSGIDLIKYISPQNLTCTSTVENCFTYG